MSVPGFEAFLLPVMRSFAGGGELPSAEVIAHVARSMGLSESDLAERLPNFPREAHDMVNRIEKRLALIDGATLGRLLYDFGVGVSVDRVLSVKRIDEDTFIEE